MEKKNLLIAQSGGPTVAINATLVGILQAARTSTKIGNIYGALYGIQGVLDGRFLPLEDVMCDTTTLAGLCQTPGAALGSCRRKLKDWQVDDADYKQVVEMLRAHKIGCFIYIGGNDSMDTVAKLAAYMEAKGESDIVVLGAPKTVDNDLMGTDHCPGFGSAAKYVATTCLELERDIAGYDTPAVTIVEVMGRNAGWLTASSALARLGGAHGPDLIYLCEEPFYIEKFIEDVKEVLKKKQAVLVVVSEGLKDVTGNYIGSGKIGKAANAQKEVDDFGHGTIAGVAQGLAVYLRERVDCKVRDIELSLMQRSATHIASQVDLEESKMLGMKAFHSAMDRENGKMVAIKRVQNQPYIIEYVTVAAKDVANKEKCVPLEWITAKKTDVTQEMIDYLQPLIQGEVPIQFEQGIPKHLILHG